MSYTQVQTRTTDDANSHADINQLQLNIEALKGGVGATSPVTTINDLNTWKTDFVEDFGAVENLKKLHEKHLKRVK